MDHPEYWQLMSLSRAQAPPFVCSIRCHQPIWLTGGIKNNA